jgi:hypothetical protein
VSECDKRTSLLHHSLNYNGKKLYNTCPWNKKSLMRRYDTQYNDIQHNGSLHGDILYNDIQQNDSLHTDKSA